MLNGTEEIEKLKAQVERYEREIRELRDIIDEKPGKMVGNSGEMRAVYKQIKACAGNDAPALIYGNDGTGKELTARTIAELSPRKGGPFTVLGCANLRESFGNPASAFESELFGYERGAFLGANTRHIGKAELANGGTLFLDDVSALGLPDQEKLLRFMQGQTFNRLGGNMQLHSDVRLIAASSKNLEEMMQQKLFREDLFYRLNVIPVSLSPLRERKEDVEDLANYFIRQYAPAGEPYTLSPEALKKLEAHDWPGNIRELENVIQRTLCFTDPGTITADDLQIEEMASHPIHQIQGNSLSGINSFDAFQEMQQQQEIAFLKSKIQECGGSISLAAEKLGMLRTTLYNRLSRLGINVKNIK